MFKICFLHSLYTWERVYIDTVSKKYLKVYIIIIIIIMDYSVQRYPC